jgi:hypothetical protein
MALSLPELVHQIAADIFELMMRRWLALAVKDKMQRACRLDEEANERRANKEM